MESFYAPAIQKIKDVTTPGRQFKKMGFLKRFCRQMAYCERYKAQPGDHHSRRDLCSLIFKS
jgi:hypothetical protein